VVLKTRRGPIVWARTIGIVLGITLQLSQRQASADVEHQALDLDLYESSAPLPELAAELRLRVLSNSNARAVGCSPIAELPTTQLCFFKTKPGMNAALNRVTERLETNRVLLTDREHATNSKNLELDGHDLKLRDIARVMREHDEQRERLVRDAAPATLRWMIDVELDFREQFLEPHLASRKLGVLLALPADGDDAALQHEVLHAVFFTNRKYRRAVEFFWRGLDDGQRGAIKERLQWYGYDVTDNALLLNEVQAYLLMPGAKNELLGDGRPRDNGSSL